MGIDKYAYHSKIAHVKAENKLACAGSLLVICLVFSSDIISLMTIVFMALATLLLGGFGLKVYLRLLTIPITFLVTGVITIIINQFKSAGDALFSIHIFGGLYGISFNSLQIGLNLFLKSFGAISCLYFFSLNTPMNSFLSLLRKKFSGMIVELMELIYRFIFIIWEEANKIHVAQASRLGYEGFKNSMNSLGELVTTVFIRAFRRADRIHVSLESRGFEGNFDFLIEEENTSKLLNTCTLIASALLITIGIIERLIG